MRKSVTYPILRRMLGYVYDQHLHHQCYLMSLDIQVRLLICWHEYVQKCYEMYAYVVTQ